MTDKSKAYADGLKLAYSATFVPQSQSRNAGNNTPTLNWVVSLGGLSTEYTQGIGHMPGYKFQFRRTIHQAELEQEAAEKGIAGFKRIPPPSLEDVLYSLVSDSEVLDYASFEEWADSYGYDTDSREAEKTYQQCLAIALKLRQLIDLEAAREAFEDY